MSIQSTAVTFRALDGLRLSGTLVRPYQPTQRAAVLVHGGGVTREEGGFFTRLAAGDWLTLVSLPCASTSAAMVKVMAGRRN